MVGLGSLWTHLLAYLLVMNVQIDLKYSLCLDERCTLGLNVCNSSLLGNVHVGMAWVIPSAYLVLMGGNMELYFSL